MNIGVYVLGTIKFHHKQEKISWYMFLISQNLHTFWFIWG